MTSARLEDGHVAERIIEANGGVLEGVFRVVDVAQHAPANAEHQRTVPPQDRLECRLVALPQEGVEQLCIGQTFPLGQ